MHLKLTLLKLYLDYQIMGYLKSKIFNKRVLLFTVIII
jgi:hypothetical protein